MSNNDRDRRDRDDPIDVEYEPAVHHHYRPGGGIGLGSALVLAVVSAGAGAAGGAIAPRVPEIRSLLDKSIPDPASPAVAANPNTPAQAGSIEARLRAVESTLSTPLPAAASAGADGANTTARVFALQSGLQEVQARLNRMPSTEEVAALVVEVQRMQQDLPAVAQQARTASEAARAAFAVAAAAEASRSSGSFEQSYTSLQALLPDDPNVIALAALSRTGAPTRSELRDEFERIDYDIIRKAREAEAGSGFWGRIQAMLAQWIIVRRTGEGDTPAGVVERAEAALRADNLAEAIREVNRLNGPAKNVAQRWLANAQRRLEIDTRIAAIRTELSRRS